MVVQESKARAKIDEIGISQETVCVEKSTPVMNAINQNHTHASLSMMTDQGWTSIFKKQIWI